MSCIKEPMTAIKDTKPVYDLYTSSIEDWHREILAKIPGQPNTTQARSGSTVFEITNHMLGISLLKGNALSYAADSDLFRLFGQDQNQTEFLTIYATDPKNNLNRYTYSPSQWTEGSVSGFSFEVERELLSHLEDRMVALFFFYKHTPYGLEKNGCIVKI
jgi:hypothetical protein